MRIGTPFFAVIAVVIWATGVTTDAAVPSETIRVAIVKNAPSVVVDGDGLLATRETGAAVALVPPVSIKPGINAVVANGTSYRRLTMASPSAVIVNGKPYRGRAEVSPGEKGLLVVNELPLEEYLVGLINCEISSAWPMEAVKAQAIIARTYALHRKELRKNSFYHLESTVIDQVYDGCLIEDSRAQRAVNETAGEVLTYNGALIQAFYHSNCGGRTEASENVWGMSLPYLKGVECEYCLTNPSSVWEQRLSFKDIEDKLRLAGHRVLGVSDVRPGIRNSRGRLNNVVVYSIGRELSLTGDQFRKVVGYGIIKSTQFTIKSGKTDVLFSGTGNGHGVGLCQWGAKQRALDGFSFAEILSYYYPGTTLKRFFDIR